MSESKIIIHGNDWEKSHVIDSIKVCRKGNWEKVIWKPRPALIHKVSGSASLYLGQKYDPNKIDLVQNGWTHDHCLVCWWELFETDEDAHGIGYFDGHSYLCLECYERFIQKQELKVE